MDQYSRCLDLPFCYFRRINSKASFNDFKEVFIATLKQMKETIITMLCVLGCAKIMGYAGMIASIATFAIAVTGSFYPFVAPCLGCLGTFVTGSGTSSGVLFGAVQQNAAVSLNADPYWIVALNSLGVAAGKMLSPQSIAIALSSVDQKERIQSYYLRSFHMGLVS